MAQNKVEYHIQKDSELTFKVAAGETLYAGDVVELKGDMTVGAALANSEKVLGVVTAGTVGNIGYRNPDPYTVGLVGFSGDRKEVVSVAIIGSLVYVPIAGVVNAGDAFSAGKDGTYKLADPAKPESKLGIVVSAKTNVAGRVLVNFKGR
ncbi:hypothetical protein BTH41_04257 [Bacillus mycoides]|nr:hypothetical protein BTH41_04257 [Bacillus mycoides]